MILFILLISLLAVFFLIQGKYEEEIYDRFERKFDKVDDMIEYLSTFGARGHGNAYELDALKVADKLRNVPNFKDDISKTSEYDDLEKIKRDIKNLPDYMNKDKQELLDLAESKQDRIGKELEKLTEERRKQREDDERRERENARIQKRRDEIKEELDRLSDSRDISKIRNRINSLSDEADTSDLESQLEGIKTSLEEQRVEDTRESKEANLDSSDRRKRTNAVRWLREHPQ